MKAFGSDNYSPIHPEVMDRLNAVNEEHAVAYGDDPYTQDAVATLQKHLGEDTQIRFVFNGTGANILCLSALLNPWESVLCADSAHIHTDECGAPEHVSGLKLIAIPTPDGKLTAELIAPHIEVHEHARQPRVVSITNVTELGTVYGPDELKNLAEYVHSRGLYLHCDGARIANAVVACDCDMAALTSEAGLDALSLGGTKNAMMFGEAAMWFRTTHHKGLRGSSWFLRKEKMQLASKMRYIAAQFSAMYEGDLWQRCARHANTMVKRLVDGLPDSVELAYRPDANEVFAYLPKDAIEALQERFHFYTWDEGEGIIRWVTSWDTTESEVDELLDALRTI